MNKSFKVHKTTLAHTSLNSYLQPLRGNYCQVLPVGICSIHLIFSARFSCTFICLACPISLLPEDENSALYFFVFLTVLSTEQALQNTSSLITDTFVYPVWNIAHGVAQKLQSLNLSTGKSSHNISYGGGKVTLLLCSGQDNQEIRGFYLMQSNHRCTDNKRKRGREKRYDCIHESVRLKGFRANFLAGSSPCPNVEALKKKRQGGSGPGDSTKLIC